ENLKIKKISGNVITGKKLVHYMEGYVKIFLGGELPEPKSMLEATAEANHLAAKDDSLEVYKRAMDDVCGPGTPYLNPAQLEETNTNSTEDALKLFRTIKKMGGAA
uniref:hypothetical protein n=1 Tax=Salmonella sp. s51228 TaxID=3159652 RepID=UPI00397F09FD